MTLDPFRPFGCMAHRACDGNNLVRRMFLAEAVNPGLLRGLWPGQAAAGDEQEINVLFALPRARRRKMPDIGKLLLGRNPAPARGQTAATRAAGSP